VGYTEFQRLLACWRDSIPDWMVNKETAKQVNKAVRRETAQSGKIGMK
jgi:hypothetical protein